MLIIKGMVHIAVQTIDSPCYFLKFHLCVPGKKESQKGLERHNTNQLQMARGRPKFLEHI